MHLITAMAPRVNWGRLSSLLAASVLLTSLLLAQTDRGQYKPRVLLLATGGTIAGKGDSSTSLTQYKPGSLLGDELVKAVPEIAQYANVRVEQISNVGSSNLTIDHWIKLAKRINQAFAGDPALAGVVVTHGTDTIEETAYFLNLTVQHDRPVVLVGAMRPSTAISADGPLNLLNGIRTAIAAEARGKGVLVVMNEEINGAREVTKTNTHRVEALRSNDFGYLGYVDDDKVSFYRASTKRHTTRSEFDVSKLEQLPAVEILYSYLQPNTAVIHALVQSGVRGIVFAGTGAGNIGDIQKSAIEQIQKSRAAAPIVVRSSRTGTGRVSAREDYDKLGIIPADTLNPQKARILLMLALTRTTDRKEIKRMFDEY